MKCEVCSDSKSTFDLIWFHCLLLYAHIIICISFSHLKFSESLRWKILIIAHEEGKKGENEKEDWIEWKIQIIYDLKSNKNIVETKKPMKNLCVKKKTRTTWLIRHFLGSFFLLMRLLSLKWIVKFVLFSRCVFLSIW